LSKVGQQYFTLNEVSYKTDNHNKNTYIISHLLTPSSVSMDFIDTKSMTTD